MLCLCKTGYNSHTIRNSLTLLNQLAFYVSRKVVLPSNTMTCPHNSPNMAQSGPQMLLFGQTQCNNLKPTDLAVSQATWLEIQCRGHLVHPRFQNFCSFHPSVWPKRTLRPLHQCTVSSAKLGCRCHPDCVWPVPKPAPNFAKVATPIVPLPNSCQGRLYHQSP